MYELWLWVVFCMIWAVLAVGYVYWVLIDLDWRMHRINEHLTNLNYLPDRER
jgi:hypothetical protein